MKKYVVEWIWYVVKFSSPVLFKFFLSIYQYYHTEHNIIIKLLIFIRQCKPKVLFISLNLLPDTLKNKLSNYLLIRYQ